MKTFQRILVWVEKSPEGRQAVERAATVARESGATLTLAHCVEPPPRLLSALYTRVDELHVLLLREWESHLEELAAELFSEGLKVETRLLEGRPFLAFTREVLEHEHDLLIKPADEAGDGVKLGTRDMHLLRKCPCAVWITGKEPASDRRILALVKPDPESDDLNLRLLEVGAALAASRGAELHVAHVWDAAGTSLLSKHVSNEDLMVYAEQTERRAAVELTELLERAEPAISAERVHLVRGAVRDAVPDLVERLDVGLIVMGTLSRAGIKGLLIGNSAESLLARTDRPVLTIKPDGFVSPVALDAA